MDDYTDIIKLNMNNEDIIDNEIDKEFLYEMEFRDIVDKLYDDIIVKYKELYPEILYNYTYYDFSIFLEKKLYNLINKLN